MAKHFLNKDTQVLHICLIYQKKNHIDKYLYFRMGINYWRESFYDVKRGKSKKVKALSESRPCVALT